MTDQSTVADAPGAGYMGYIPLRITLTGFRGIRSGLGRDTLTLDLEATLGSASLVAIAGANGRGKTTLLENLHPHLVMPSRAGSDGLGAFSFYDHVYLPESQKELIWAHGGRRYKTHLVFRLNGKRKTEAFLFESTGSGWKPVALADGTPTDGKVDTYERAVNEILGPPETFFTSVFSAQGKRPLSAYKNGEVKTLLADLLGLDEVRAEGARTGEVVRLLKAGLAVIRQEQAKAADALAKLERQLQASVGSADKVQAAQAAKRQAMRHVEDGQAAVTRLAAEAQAATATEKRRGELVTDRARAVREHDQATRRLEEEAQRLARRATAISERMGSRQRQHAERRSRLARQRQQLCEVAAGAQRVAWAGRRAETAAASVEARSGLLRAAQDEVNKVEGLRAQQRLQRQELQAIDREAGQLALRQADLGRRFGLVAQVPCAGTDLQGRCQLLGDAREAQALTPSVEGQLAAIGERKRQALQSLSTIGVELERIGDAAQRRNRGEQRLEASQARQSRLALLAAKEGEVRRAVDGLRAIEEELSGLPEAAASETEEEAAERRDIAAAQQRLAQERERSAASLREALERIDAALNALPVPYDETRLAQARRAAEEAARLLRQAEEAEVAAVRLHEQAIGLQRQVEAAREEQATADARALRVERELGTWTLLAKCLSNDGVIALDIDDAGPTFSALANDLLLACYGPRFTLEVITQTETAKGELRENFDIIVHDGLRGEAKSLKLVSGGERTWISCRSRHEIHYAENLDMPSSQSGQRARPCNCPAGTCEAMRHNTAGPAAISSNARGGKSLSLMSGGERTFIDACLTRAIALYLAQNTGRRFDTLFSDEADGPLDPEHKRMFMAMKREVLRLGGYRQEFFITQTPHLAAMADAIIDLDAMQVDVD